MENNGIRKLSGIGDFASVELSNDGQDIVHIHFMNTSIRMCSHQFEKFIIMLNEAMMNINNNDSYYHRMKEVFNAYRELKSLELIGDKNKIH